jgi:hypothetical protein
MLTLQQISDRLEVGDLLHTYSAAIDLQQWEVMDQVFTADASFDFVAMTGFSADCLDDFRDWLRGGLTPLRGQYFHMSVPTQIVIDGDTAQMISTCFNPMTIGGDNVVFGHYYKDAVTRTADGWRISRREIVPCFRVAVPAQPSSGPPP